MKRERAVRHRLLALVQLPPPLHGAALMNELATSSARFHEAFDLRVVNLAPRQDITTLGAFTMRKLGLVVLVTVRCIHALVRFRPQLVYITIAPAGFAFIRDFLITMLSKSLRRPVVCHLHGQGFADRVAKGGVHRWLCRQLFRGIDTIVLAPRLARDVEGLVPEDRLHVIANGIPDPFGARPTSPPRDEIAPCRLLYLANLQETKGPLVLLEAIKRVRAQGLSVHAEFCGAFRPPLTQERMEALVAEAGLDKEVTLRGPVYGEAKLSAFRAADIFVYPTYRDAFPLVLVEALAAGLPVVTTTEGGIPDFIFHGQTGLLVPPRDALALAQAIADLARDPGQRMALGAAARSSYLENYTLEHFEIALVGVLARLASLRASPPTSSSPPPR